VLGNGHRTTNYCLKVALQTLLERIGWNQLFKAGWNIKFLNEEKGGEEKKGFTFCSNENYGFMYFYIWLNHTKMLSYDIIRRDINKIMRSVSKSLPNSNITSIVRGYIS